MVELACFLTTPAHPHATSVAVYTALFNGQNAFYYYAIFKRISLVSFYMRQSRFLRATRTIITFVRSLHSLCSLAMQCFARLRLLCSLAPFKDSLTHSAHSLMGWLKFMIMCSHWKRISWESTHLLSSLETRPKLLGFWSLCRLSSLQFRFHFVIQILVATVEFVNKQPKLEEGV